jgi:hypothetical protein
MIDQEIARRMDAYRGNPQALMQRYQQSQQLLDLLALQKLKSEKEAAMREMQLAQGPQSGLPTVAEQREQELLDMTKQELASQVGGVARQQQQAMQGNLQKLMSGIARAPGAQNVMPPQAMAAGGIVAFRTGGDEGLSEADRERISDLERDETRRLMQRYPRPEPRSFAERIDRQREEKGSIYSPYFGMTPSEREAAKLRERGLAQVIERDRPIEPVVPGIAAALKSIGEAGSIDRYLAANAAAPDVAAERRRVEAEEITLAQQAAAAERQRQADLAAARPREGGQAPATPAARPPAPATPTAPAGPDPFAATVKSAISGAFADPMDEYQRLAAAYPQMSAEEKAAAAQRMQRRRAMVEEQFDPRRQGIEQLLRMGATFGRGLTPGTAAPSTAEVGLDYAARQRAARAQAEEGLLGLEEKAAAEELAGRRAAAEAGGKAYQESARGRTAALGAGATIISAETRAEVDKLQSDNARIANELKAKELTTTKLMTLQGTLRGKLAETERKIRDDVASNQMVALQRNALLNKLQQNPNDTKARDALRVLDDDLTAAVESNSAVREARRLLEFVDRQLGIPSAPAPASAPSTAGFRITSVK